MFPRHWVFGDAWYVEMPQSLQLKLSELDLWPRTRPVARRHYSLPAGVSRSQPRSVSGWVSGSWVHLLRIQHLCRGLLQALGLLLLWPWVPARYVLMPCIQRKVPEGSGKMASSSQPTPSQPTQPQTCPPTPCRSPRGPEAHPGVVRGILQPRMIHPPAACPWGSPWPPCPSSPEGPALQVRGGSPGGSHGSLSYRSQHPSPGSWEDGVQPLPSGPEGLRRQGKPQAR